MNGKGDEGQEIMFLLFRVKIPILEYFVWNYLFMDQKSKYYFLYFWFMKAEVEKSCNRRPF